MSAVANIPLECASCKAQLDPDSFFCDQCGVELLRCTACGRLGKQKRCMFCGKPLAPVRIAISTDRVATDSIAADPAPGPPPVSPPTPGAAPSVGKLRLSNAKQGIDLLPADGDILGRKFGQHVAVLGRFSQISSNHLQIKRASDGSWRVMDLNSFNHTFYNGAQLEPQRECPIAAGGRLGLADIELTVSIE